MKYVLYGVAATLGLILALMGVSPVQGGMMGQGQMRQPGETREPSPGGMIGQEGMGGMGMMRPQMMQQMMRGMMGGGMQGMPEGMGMPQPSRLVRMLKEELGLSDDQTKQLKPLVLQAIKTEIKQRADLHIAEIELGGLLEADPVDMAQVEAQLKSIEGLRTTLRLTLIKAHEQAQALLTPEQRQKLERLHDRMPGMMEMMGEGGMSGMGMMGGGMGGQTQGLASMAGSPQHLTQENTQGAVTVSATLLNPDKPRLDGKLAVLVKLDTHSIDLDSYQLEKVAILRDAQGREIQALGLESLSGSGHHREGVLTFPGTDADGKPLLSPEAKAVTLILGGVGGVQERVFRWQLPLG